MYKKAFLLYFLIFSLFVSGCNTTLCDNTDFKIYKEDGRWFIQFYKDYMLPTSHGSREASFPKFDTVNEMKQAVATGNIPYSNMMDIHQNTKTEPFEIIDPTLWYEFSLPQYRSVKAVSWEGDAIRYYINGYNSEKDNPNGFKYSAFETFSVTILKKSDYEKKLENANSKVAQDDLSIRLKEQVPYQNATKYVYDPIGGEGYYRYETIFVYDFKASDENRHVFESYTSDKSGRFHKNGSDLMAAGNARIVDIYWTDGTAYFWVHVNTTIPVTDEWLQAFQMTPITD